MQSWSRITCWIEVTRHTYLVLCLGAHDTLTVISWSSHCTATRFDPRLDRLVVVLHWGATGHNISSSLSKHSGVRSAGLGRGYPIKDSNLFFLTSLLDASLDLYLFFYIYIIVFLCILNVLTHCQLGQYCHPRVKYRVGTRTSAGGWAGSWWCLKQAALGLTDCLGKGSQLGFSILTSKVYVGCCHT